MPTATSPSSAEPPVVIEARGVEKTFRIPTHRIDSLKERAVHPIRRPSYQELRALADVSFDVRRGEFFGIVGRNGSGKSTLLKVLASIYRADAGTIRMAGRLAPFIELGVGFNPEFTARENVELNGVMMGLSRREARKTLDAVLEFAELGEFVELKLKNYSSGMLVRLAFAVMIQANADIMLIDEVLAVGDAAFQQKCADVFHDLRDAGKTIVLVTHDMAAVEEYCHRAMLIDDGEVRRIGDPREVSKRYMRLNFERGDDGAEQSFAGQGGGEDARLVRSWLEDADGGPISNVEHGQPLRFRAVVEARAEVPVPSFGLNIINADGVMVSGFGMPLTVSGEEAEELRAGQRVRVAATIENPLTPGRYSIGFWVCRNRNVGDVALLIERVLDFVVYGPVWAPGIVALEAELEAVPEEEEGR